MNKYQPLIYKTIAVLLAWFVPVGLHRLIMRRHYAWLQPLALLLATSASIQFFFYTPENAELARNFIEQGGVPHIGQYTHVWLLGFTAAWMALAIYDAIMIFSWTVNNPQAEAVGVGQVVDHDQAAQ
jgi:hypothetical protein